GQLDGPEARLQRALAEAVAAVGAVRRALAVLGAAEPLGVGLHELVQEHGEHLPQGVGVAVGENVADELAELYVLHGHRGQPRWAGRLATPSYETPMAIVQLQPAGCGATPRPGTLPAAACSAPPAAHPRARGEHRTRDRARLAGAGS